MNSDPSPEVTLQRNEDPITHEPGAHPVSTGVGAAGGGATGAAIGMAVGGPIGGIIGAVIGAVAGGLGGSAVGEAIEPTQVNEAWPGEDQATNSGELSSTPSGFLHAEELSSAPSGSTHPEEFSSASVHSGHLEEPPIAPADRFAPNLSAETASPNHEEIALRAWTYYETEGKPDGHALEHWLRSEEELKQTGASGTGGAV